jgi:hypothetical protein
MNAKTKTSTMRTALLTLATSIGTLALIGCGDPLSGEWEHVDSSDVDLEIEASDDGWEGEGHLWVCAGEDCWLCPIELEITEDGDRYEVEGRFTHECSDIGSFDGVECELEGDDELECELPDGAGTLEYERAD